MSGFARFFVPWHINLCGLFNAKSILVEKWQWYFITLNLENNRIHTVTYWPSTEPSIKRCTCVNKRKKQVHPVEDVGISPWPVDVVEFGADAYAHRKRVSVKQLYNQVPQMAWVSQFESVPVQSQSQLEIGCPRSENQHQTEGMGPQDPRLSSPAEWGRSAAMVRRTLGQYVAVCPHLQLTSHTKPTSTLLQPFHNPFENKVWEVYFYKEVCSFFEVVHYCWLFFRIHLYMYMYSCIMAIQQYFCQVRNWI